MPRKSILFAATLEGYRKLEGHYPSLIEMSLEYKRMPLIVKAERVIEFVEAKAKEREHGN